MTSQNVYVNSAIKEKYKIYFNGFVSNKERSKEP